MRALRQKDFELAETIPAMSDKFLIASLQFLIDSTIMLVLTAVKHEEEKKKKGEQEHALSSSNTNVKGKGSECKQEEKWIHIWGHLACSIIFCCYSATLFAFWASLQGSVWSRDPWQGRPKLAGYTWLVPSFQQDVKRLNSTRACFVTHNRYCIKNGRWQVPTSRVIFWKRTNWMSSHMSKGFKTT